MLTHRVFWVKWFSDSPKSSSHWVTLFSWGADSQWVSYPKFRWIGNSIIHDSSVWEGTHLAVSSPSPGCNSRPRWSISRDFSLADCTWMQSPNDTTWELLSQRLSRQISAPLLTAGQGICATPDTEQGTCGGTCTTSDSWPGHLQGICATPDTEQGTCGFPAQLLTPNRAAAGYLHHSWRRTGHLQVPAPLLTVALQHGDKEK